MRGARPAIMMSGGNERHVINNTIYDVDSGVNIATPVGSLEVADNIIGNVTLARRQPLTARVRSRWRRAPSFHHNLLFGDPRD